MEEEKCSMKEAETDGPFCDDPYDELAREIVKKRWMKQGIWNNKWKEKVGMKWKHEELLQDLESESETASGTHLDGSAPTSLSPTPRPRHRKPTSAERLVRRERERQASRPYHQFMYQVDRERERLHVLWKTSDDDGVRVADINSIAYENIRRLCENKDLWNYGWAKLPGMTWQHEFTGLEVNKSPALPDEDDGTQRDIYNREITNFDKGGYYLQPVRPPPASNHGQVLGTPDSPPRGLLARVMSMTGLKPSKDEGKMDNKNVE